MSSEEAFEVPDITMTWCRRKTIGLYVSAEKGVELRVPHFLSRQEALQFAASKRKWIEKQVAALNARPSRYQPIWYWGETHYVLGEPLILHCRDDKGVDVLLQGHPDDRSEAIEKRVMTWYRQQARQLFRERHQLWSARLESLGLSESSVEPRLMKRRWGSCRSNGRITINTHLIKYPLECVDTVIVHELCHLKEFNHSKRFYQLMDTAMPGWRRWDAMLNDLSQQY